MIFSDRDFLGSKPARRADGKSWEVWQLEGGRPARSANAPTVTIDRRTLVSEGKTNNPNTHTREQTAQSAHLKREPVVGSNGAQAHAREEAVQHATEIKLRAERKAGEILRETPKATGGEHGGRAQIDGPREKPSNPTPTLADLNVTKKESSCLSSVEPPAKLSVLLARHPEGVSARHVLRARLAPDSATAVDLLEGLARAGRLERHEDHPAHGGKPLVRFALPA